MATACSTVAPGSGHRLLLSTWDAGSPAGSSLSLLHSSGTDGRQRPAPSLAIIAGFVASPGSAMACPLIKCLTQLMDCPPRGEQQEGSETPPPSGGAFLVADTTWPLRGT